MLFSIITLTLAAIFTAYFIIMQIFSPGTLLGTIFSFSAFWLIFAVICIILFLLRNKKPWKKLPFAVKTGFFTACGILFVIFGINLYQICTPRLADGNEKPEYVIVLGGGITKNAELTDSVKQRIFLAADYLKSHPEAIAVVTGGTGPFSPCAESVVLKKELVNLGIESERILEEDQAKDTIDNFEFSAKLLARHKNLPVEKILESPVTVITNDFHIARAERLAARMGFKDVYGKAATTPPVFVPNAYGRELCCYIKLNLRILLTGKPQVITENR